MNQIRGTYQRYSDTTRLAVINSGNLSLFESIPRSTARYWKNNAKDFQLDSLTTVENLQSKKIAKLEDKVKQLSSLISLIEKVNNIFPFSFSEKRIKKKSLRNKIITEIQTASKYNNLTKCLRAIGMTPSMYKRWKSEIRSCQFTGDACSKRLKNQLTYEELEIMKFYATSKKYAHISISSLHLLSQRQGKLFCSVDSWYRYINLYDWRSKERRINFK